MIPHRLSNGICFVYAPICLNVGKVVAWKLVASGCVVKHEIFDSVIHSDYRFMYDAVNQIITEKDPNIREQYKEITPMLKI